MVFQKTSKKNCNNVVTNKNNVWNLMKYNSYIVSNIKRNQMSFDNFFEEVKKNLITKRRKRIYR